MKRYSGPFVMPVLICRKVVAMADSVISSIRPVASKPEHLGPLLGIFYYELFEVCGGIGKLELQNRVAWFNSGRSLTARVRRLARQPALEVVS